MARLDGYRLEWAAYVCAFVFVRARVCVSPGAIPPMIQGPYPVRRTLGLFVSLDECSRCRYGESEEKTREIMRSAPGIYDRYSSWRYRALLLLNGRKKNAPLARETILMPVPRSVLRISRRHVWLLAQLIAGCIKLRREDDAAVLRLVSKTCDRTQCHSKITKRKLGFADQ